MQSLYARKEPALSESFTNPRIEYEWEHYLGGYNNQNIKSCPAQFRKIRQQTLDCSNKHRPRRELETGSVGPDNEEGPAVWWAPGNCCRLWSRVSITVIIMATVIRSTGYSAQPRRGGGMPFRHLETWLETGRQSPCLGVLPADCTAGTCLGPNLQHLPAVRVSSAVCSQAREIIFVFWSYILSTLCRATSLYLSSLGSGHLHLNWFYILILTWIHTIPPPKY